MKEVSVCLIVRDEEDKIYDCLSSVTDFADEIIVVDTGSVDDTVAIAKQFTEHVYHFEWCDDFSKARNYSISKATKHFIFQLDADEIFNAEIGDELKSLLVDDVVLIKTSIREYQSRESFYIARANNPRLFLNRQDIRYYRSYHEMVFNDCNRISKDENLRIIGFDKVVTDHYGYEFSSLDQKYNRGIRIMSSWLEDYPNDDYILSKLADSYLGTDNIDMAFYLAERAYKVNNKSTAVVFTYATVMLKMKRYGDVIDCLSACTDMSIKNMVYYTVLGQAHFNLHQFPGAKECFERAIECDTNYSNSYCNMALVHMVNNEAELAVKNLERAYELNKSDFSSLNTAGYIYMKINDVEKMADCFKKSLSINPEQPDLLKFIRENQLENILP